MNRIKKILKNPYFGKCDKFLAIILFRRLWEGEPLFDADLPDELCKNLAEQIEKGDIKIWGQKELT